MPSFKERNESWDGKRREFRQLNSRSEVPRLWIVEVRGNKILTWWGLQGGAMQSATETLLGVNIGKKNEVSGPEYAIQRAAEACRKKNREGYTEFRNGSAIDDKVETDIDFDNLPSSLCFYKPDNSMGAAITKKASAGKVWYTRKRDGLAHIIARGNGSAHIYSRRMFRKHDDEMSSEYTWDDRFPHLVEEANKFMPKNSIILGELIVMGKGGKDSLKMVESLTKSLTPQSLKDQDTFGKPSFYVWDIAFWAGEDLVSTKPVKDRYSAIEDITGSCKYFLPVEICSFGNSTAAVVFAKKMGWEGFVVVDPDGIYGDKAYNFRGKPDRPGSVCAKLKPEFEDDFVVMWDPQANIGERSTKASSGMGIKSVALYQYNKDGELVYICNCASGMTQKMKKDLADPANFPRVWSVAYTSRSFVHRGDDTNALIFPRFIADRHDKLPEECLTPALKKEKET